MSSQMQSHEQNQTHHHHRHHRHRPFYRLRHWVKKNKKFFIFAIVLSLVTAAGLIFFALHLRNQQISRQVSSKNSRDVGMAYREITYQGKTYRYNNLITTVLYAGIDSTGEMLPTAAYAQAARADSISLVVLDKKHRKMTILAINRDTMTEVRRYTMNGIDRGLGVTHLGFAYTYGDGGEASCENLLEAVEGLFYGIPIREYAVTNVSSLPYINHLAGGVTLQVPNDDLIEQRPEWYQGAEVTIRDEEAESYLRYRDASVDYSNEGRMERQRSYISAYIDQIKDRVEADPQGVWTELEDMDSYIQTSITKNKYLDMVHLFEQMDLDQTEIYRLEGTDQEGEFHDEFYVDEEALREKILQVFYEEIN